MATHHSAFWDRQWDLVTGCSHAGSPGCDNCIAKARLALRGKSFEVQLHLDRLWEPLEWQEPQRVLACWKADLFHEEVPFGFILGVFGTMAECPQHTFYLLTKRAERMYDLAIPLPNVWLGVTVEDQGHVGRVDFVRAEPSPAHHRFINIEPMLSAVEFDSLDGIDWVHCAGEYGRNARPLDLDAARSLRDQCREAGVPFYFKGAGEGVRTPSDLDVQEFPEGLRNG